MKNLVIISLLIFIIIAITGWKYDDSNNNKIEKYAIMKQATLNSYEYIIELGTTPEYSEKEKELNIGLSKIDNEIDALDFILKQGFELHSCLYGTGGNKIVYILKMKR